LQIAPIQNYNLSMSGKTNRSNYYVSGSYTNEEGIQLNDEFSRITLHSNVESKITDWLTVGLNSSYSFRDYSGLEASLGDARAAVLWQTIRLACRIMTCILLGKHICRILLIICMLIIRITGMTCYLQEMPG